MKRNENYWKYKKFKILIEGHAEKKSYLSIVKKNKKKRLKVNCLEKIIIIKI